MTLGSFALLLGRLSRGLRLSARIGDAVRWQVEMPNWRLALGQLLIGTANFVFVSACLHQLMRAYGEIAFST